MVLPLMPPVAPMLAKPVGDLPEGAWSFEPKWDGFRTIVFRDGDEVELGSRRERPMTRYFPEVTEAVRAELPPRCVVDAEIVVPDADCRRLDFDALLLRIHPAASRVRLLAEQTPARLICFDLLALEGGGYMGEPRARRRGAPGAALARGGGGAAAGVRVGMVWSPSFWRGSMSRTGGCGARSSTPGPPTAWSAATGSTSVAPIWSGRCCWGCTPTPGSWPWPG